MFAGRPLKLIAARESGFECIAWDWISGEWRPYQYGVNPVFELFLFSRMRRDVSDLKLA